MNCNNLLQFAAVLSALPFFWSSAFAAQDLYFNESLSNDDRYLNESSNWFTDEGRTRQFDGTLSSDYNGIVNREGASKHVAATGTLELNSLSFIMSNVSSASAGDNLLSLGGSVALSGDLNFDISMSESDTSGANVNDSIYLYSGSAKLTVGGDVNISYSQPGNTFYSLRMLYAGNVSGGDSAEVSVGGDFNAGSPTGSALRLNISVANFRVDGVMNIGNTIWTLSSSANNGGSSYLSRTIGGLDSGGQSGSIITTATAIDTGLVFKNAAQCEWLGSFGANGNLNLSMEASDAQNGRQIIRFTRKGYGDSADINDVTVSNGRLDLGMHSEMKGNRLSISGSQAVFSATATDSGEIGTVTFDEGEWYAGKIAVDIEGELSYDKIVFNGRFDKTGSDRDMGFEFSFDAYAMREFISAGGGEFILEDVITYETGSSMAGTVLEGSASGIRWEAVFGDTSLSVTFTVPEPAAVAAILGSIALAFAIRRRRR